MTELIKMMSFKWTLKSMIITRLNKHTILLLDKKI